MTIATLSGLLKGISSDFLESNLTVSGLSTDSRIVKPGDLFLAYPGTHLDGRKFILEAIQKGANAIATEKDNLPLHVSNSIPIIPIKNLKTHLSEIAARFYEQPTKGMEIVGITGTNGKTSCTHFIASLLQRINKPCGIIGTLGNGLYEKLNPTTLTTPDAISLQKILSEFRDQKLKYVAMEVSSHSLDQDRVNSIPFSVGIFTNLTRDHLDYHGTMEAYGAAKMKLFTHPPLKYSVINVDDAFGQQIGAACKNTLSYSIENPRADVFAQQIQLTNAGLVAHIRTPWGEGKIHSSLMGKFNLSNILAVLSTLSLLKIPFQILLDEIKYITPVPGRMQLFGGLGKPLVVVDYSHTPDSLEKALSSLREHCQGKLHCIFGCGGDRDKGKRPLMAKKAEELADVVIITDDNPRTENPKHIVADILKGILNTEKIIIQHDRSKAIHDVIQYANGEDTILVAGKGAETVQLIDDQRISFSDAEHVMSALKALGEK